MVVVWELGSLVGKPLYFSILIDKYRLGFGSTVLMIRARVFIFRYSYIKDHPGSFRFHCILGVFVTSILLLIFSHFSLYGDRKTIVIYDSEKFKQASTNEVRLTSL